MKFDLNRPWLLRFFSLFLAILLFAYVSYEQNNRFHTNRPNNGASVVSSEVITNMPIEVNIDTERYFVTGIPDSATIRLEGPQAVLFQTSVTQNFRIATPDLNEYGVGAHVIDLEAVGLSNEINYAISPAQITVNIEEKVFETFPIEVEIHPDFELAEGFTVLDTELSQSTVELSGSTSTMEKIDRVIAVVNSSQEDIRQNTTVSAGLVVLDQENNPLNVNSELQEVEVYLSIAETQKAVPIVLEKTGRQNNQYEYEITLAEGQPESIKVSGIPGAIREINNLVLEVDLTGITKSQVIDIPITDLPEGIESASQDTVRVRIDITENDEIME